MRNKPPWLLCGALLLSLSACRSITLTPLPANDFVLGPAPAPEPAPDKALARERSRKYSEAVSSETGVSEIQYTKEALLKEKEESVTETTLEGGRTYVFLAETDDNIKTLNLKVFNENGHEVKADMDADHTPVVKVTPKWTGAFKIVVIHQEGRPGYYSMVALAQERSASDPQLAKARSLELSRGLIGESDFTEVVHQETRTLEPRGRSSLDVRLEGRRSYVFVAATDDNIEDLDILIFDENGNEVARDQDNDNTPMVTVTPAWTGSFKIVVFNYQGQQGCYHLTALAQEGGGADSQEAVTRAAQMYSQLAGRTQFTHILHEKTEALDHEEKSLLTAQVKAGRTYVVLAATDDNIEDLDILVFDNRRREIARDEDDDNTPMLKFTPQHDGEVTIMIVNYQGRQGYFHMALVAQEEEEEAWRLSH